MSRFNKDMKKTDRKRETPLKPSEKEEKKESETAPTVTPKPTSTATPPTSPPTPTAKPTPTQPAMSPKPSVSPPTTTTKPTLTQPTTTPSTSPVRSRQRPTTTTPPVVSKPAVSGHPTSDLSLGTKDIGSKITQPSTSLTTPPSSLKGSEILERITINKEEEDFFKDKVGSPENQVPTIPSIIKTDNNGEFNFTINSDQDITFFIEAYKVDSMSQGIQPLAASTQPKDQHFSQSNIELNLLFSTKDSYEGSWTSKKITLEKKKNYKEFTSLLENKGILFDWNVEDTPEAALQISKRVPIQTQEDLNKDKSFTNIVAKLNLNLPPLFENPVLLPKTEVIATQPIDIDDEITPKFTINSLKNVLKNKLSSVIRLNNGKELNEEFDPIMAAPKISDSMYTPLRKISLDYVLPGVGNIDNNTVFLMGENRRFIEAYMAGLNHEMNRELVWREFPTDKRGTVFTYFWDPTRLEDNGGELTPPKDIDEIHTWKQGLGNNRPTKGGANTPNLVIVIKGDVIRRYPDIIIYALKSPSAVNQTTFNSTEMEIIQPIFRSQLGPDIITMGFPLSKQELNLDATYDGVYYFVLQEQQDLPVFGFDVRQTAGSTEISWEQVKPTLRNGYIDDFSGIVGTSPNSANIAAKTMQLPVRVVIPAKVLIKGKPINS